MTFPVKKGSETRVTLAGALDYVRAPMLMEALQDLRGCEISRFVFECAALEYISSAGIRAVIFAQQKITPNAPVVIEDASADIKEIFDLCGIADCLAFTSSD